MRCTPTPVANACKARPSTVVAPRLKARSNRCIAACAAAGDSGSELPATAGDRASPQLTKRQTALALGAAALATASLSLPSRCGWADLAVCRYTAASAAALLMVPTSATHLCVLEPCPHCNGGPKDILPRTPLVEDRALEREGRCACGLEGYVARPLGHGAPRGGGIAAKHRAAYYECLTLHTRFLTVLGQIRLPCTSTSIVLVCPHRPRRRGAPRWCPGLRQLMSQRSPRRYVCACM